MNLKIIKREYRHDWEVPDDYTGIVLFDGHDVCNFINGCKEWWVNGKRHREDGPAIESNDGSKFWYVNDKRHRLDGPAWEHCNGTKFWFVDDKLHRLDGPAIEVHDGSKEWHINGNKITELEHGLLVHTTKLKNLIEKLKNLIK